jgi:hypothetical protein
MRQRGERATRASRIDGACRAQRRELGVTLKMLVASVQQDSDDPVLCYTAAQAESFQRRRSASFDSVTVISLVGWLRRSPRGEPIVSEGGGGRHRYPRRRCRVCHPREHDDGVTA